MIFSYYFSLSLCLSSAVYLLRGIRGIPFLTFHFDSFDFLSKQRSRFSFRTDSRMKAKIKNEYNKARELLIYNQMHLLSKVLFFSFQWLFYFKKFLLP